MLSPAPPPRLDDAFVRAVVEFFEKLSGGSPRGLVADGYLAGGVAVRCYADHRVTDDVDVFFEGARVLVPPNATMIVHHPGGESALTFDHQYTPTFGLLHPDFGDRAVRLVGDDASTLRLSVLHPLDLALTKIVRFEDHDRADVRALARTRCFDARDLLDLGEEALGYMIGDEAFARLNLRDAAELVEATQR